MGIFSKMLSIRECALVNNVRQICRLKNKLFSASILD